MWLRNTSTLILKELMHQNIDDAIDGMYRIENYLLYRPPSTLSS